MRWIRGGKEIKTCRKIIITMINNVKKIRSKSDEVKNK